jgi:hypothetical protein
MPKPSQPQAAEPANALAARALRWWPASEMSRLAFAVHQALCAWAQDWGLQQPGPADGGAVRCAVASDARTGAGRWQRLAPQGATGPEKAIWWSLAGSGGDLEPVALLTERLFGPALEPSALPMPGAIDGVAAEVATSAWVDLWRGIGEALGACVAVVAVEADLTMPSELMDELFCPWSGAVVVTLPWCGHELRVLLGSDAAARLFAPSKPSVTPAPAPPLVPVWHAIATATSSLRAELAPVELTLGAIKGLRVGDVIELAHPLDRPLAAKTSSGEVLCEAFLGRAGERRAIELLMPPVRA